MHSHRMPAFFLCILLFPRLYEFQLFLVGDFLGSSVVSGCYTAEQDKELKQQKDKYQQ